MVLPLGGLIASGVVGLAQGIGQIFEPVQQEAESVALTDEVDISLTSKLKSIASRFDPKQMELTDLKKMEEMLIGAGLNEAEAEALLEPLKNMIQLNVNGTTSWQDLLALHEENSWTLRAEGDGDAAFADHISKLMMKIAI